MPSGAPRSPSRHWQSTWRSPAPASRGWPATPDRAATGRSRSRRPHRAIPCRTAASGRPRQARRPPRPAGTRSGRCRTGRSPRRCPRPARAGRRRSAGLDDQPVTRGRAGRPIVVVLSRCPAPIVSKHAMQTAASTTRRSAELTRDRAGRNHQAAAQRPPAEARAESEGQSDTTLASTGSAEAGQGIPGRWQAWEAARPGDSRTGQRRRRVAPRAPVPPRIPAAGQNPTALTRGRLAVLPFPARRPAQGLRSPFNSGGKMPLGPSAIRSQGRVTACRASAARHARAARSPRRPLPAGALLPGGCRARQASRAVRRQLRAPNLPGGTALPPPQRRHIR